MRQFDIDFARWAVVAFNDETGHGRMAADIRSILGIGHHLVIPSERLETKPLQYGDILLSPDASMEQVEAVLHGLDGLILLERTRWHPELLRIAARLGIPTAIVVMWEWYQPADPLWRLCDLLICPNKKALEIVRQYGFYNSVLLPWTLDLKRLPPRKISGPARVFVHNGGLVDPDDRKGTFAAIRGFQRVKNPDLKLIVRLQKSPKFPLPNDDGRIEVRIGNLNDPAELYLEGDAAIQPSKLEGIGFMVLEAICCGIPTITQNIAPLNEYAPESALLAEPRWLKRKAYSSVWASHSHLRLPKLSALAARIEWCAQNELSEISAASREWARSTFDPESLRCAWASALRERLPLRDAGSRAAAA
jgi:glycosyltransferase involved in cell wall biosynthesis